MEEASVMMVGLNSERIMQGIIVLESQQRGEERTLRAVSDYSMPNVSEKVVRIIISYVDYIKRVIWSE
jgi:UDP-N-acetylglucosamine 2-epimerase (non-hydrolysing)